MTDFEQLYRQHAPALLRFGWGLTGDRAVAEDLVSDTFVRLMVRAPKIRTRTALAYLLAVVRNTWLTQRRRSDRLTTLPDDLPARRQDLDADMDHRARLAATMVALDDLPEGERSALLLRVDHDLSYDEIAAALDTTPGAAKVRVHRARMRLSRVLDEGETP